jgi:tight adherence protein B
MTLRILRTLAALSAVPLLVAMPLTAMGADTGGRIDHVETAGGQVNVLFSVPGLPDGVTPDASTISVTMDGKQVSAKAVPVEGSDQTIRRTAVLAIDVSQSMDGAKFTAAKEAAHAYIDTAPDDVFVGLVTFASEVKSVQTPTQDHGALTSAIDSLELTKDTRLYDGVLRALDATGKEGQRSILLLSDGTDTNSATKLETLLQRAKSADVRVDVVSLDQKVDSSSPLAQISTATGGTVTSTSDPDALKALFTGEANDLAKQLVVTFPAPQGTAEEGTLAVSVDADGQTYSDSAFATLEPAESGSSSAPTYTPKDQGLSLSRPALFGGIALFFVGMAVLLIFGATRVMPSAATPMQQQLSLYTVHGMKRSEKSTKEGGAQLKDSAVAIAQELISKRDFETSLNHKLDRAGLKLKAAEWILMHAGIALGGAFAGLVLGHNVLFALLFLFLGAVLPWFYLSFKEKRRIKAFNGQLAETLQVIAGALQAGLSLPQAIDTVVQESPDPMSSEFRRAIIEQRLGVEIEDTLDTVADRMGSIDFRWVVMAIRIQREVGGNLAELLLTVAATLREREYLRRQVAVLSAEGRLSAFILGGLPPFFVGYLLLARPEYISPMFHETLGLMMLGAACVMMTVGVFWLKKSVKVEV